MMKAIAKPAISSGKVAGGLSKSGIGGDCLLPNIRFSGIRTRSLL